MLRLVTFLALLSCRCTPAWAITIDSKLEVDPPPSLLVKKDNGELALDSSISPKVVKAFYEIHFVPVNSPDTSGNGIVTVTTSQKCPFSLYSDLCKYYYAPSKIMAVQRIDDLIEKSKGDGTVPVIQGVIADKSNTDKFMKEVNDTINNKVNAVVPLNKNKTDEVPVYKGTVDTQEVLKKPEYPPPLPYRPYYPPPARPPYPWNSNWNNGWNNCLQPPCPWQGRTPYSSGILNTKL